VGSRSYVLEQALVEPLFDGFFFFVLNGHLLVPFWFCQFYLWCKSMVVSPSYTLEQVLAEPLSMGCFFGFLMFICWFHFGFASSTCDVNHWWWTPLRLATAPVRTAYHLSKWFLAHQTWVYTSRWNMPPMAHSMECNRFWQPFFCWLYIYIAKKLH
jgi:hypothetical protein